MPFDAVVTVRSLCTSELKFSRMNLTTVDRGQGHAFTLEVITTRSTLLPRDSALLPRIGTVVAGTHPAKANMNRRTNWSL